MKRVFLTLILCLFTNPSYALDYIYTNGELYANCKPISKGINNSVYTGTHGHKAGICQGYFQAYRDIRPILQEANEKVFGGICLPRGTTLGQHIKIYMKYMDNHPQELHELKYIGITKALKETFPCK